MRRIAHVAGLVALLGSLAANAPAEPAAMRWVLLGTMGGPVASPERSQPANLMVRGDDAYLVDCGDGTVEQLAKAGIRLKSIKAVVLSHLHFDHTGGLAALLGLRYQTGVTAKLVIYGPPGTQALVDGLVASMLPAAEAGYGLPGEPSIAPSETVTVVEIGDKATFKLGDVSVLARQNTHYSFAPGSDQDRRFKSLAFRFTSPDRVIAYTGDTGPSTAVEELARNADLLVSEMIDVPATVANVKRNTPGMPDAAMRGLVEHLERHHLTPAQVGELANRAQVKAVVITHFVSGGADARTVMGYLAAIAANYRGPAAIGRDLDVY